MKESWTLEKRHLWRHCKERWIRGDTLNETHSAGEILEIRMKLLRVLNDTRFTVEVEQAQNKRAVRVIVAVEIWTISKSLFLTRATLTEKWTPVPNNRPTIDEMTKTCRGVSPTSIFGFLEIHFVHRLLILLPCTSLSAHVPWCRANELTTTCRRKFYYREGQIACIDEYMNYFWEVFPEKLLRESGRGVVWK